MEINYDKLVVECIPEIDKSTKYLENALIDSNKITDIADRHSNEMRRVINRCIEDTKNISDKMDNLGLYINKKVYDFIQIVYSTSSLDVERRLGPILLNEMPNILQREKLRKIIQNEGTSNNNNMSLDECLKLAIEEYKKNGKSDEFYRILSQNKNWYWYETLDGKKIMPGSSQYEYNEKMGKDMDLIVTDQVIELYDEMVGRRDEFDNYYFNTYILEKFVNCHLFPEKDDCNNFFTKDFDGYYGADQGMFKDGYDTEDGFEHFDNYYNAKDFLVNEYGMSEKDAKKTLKYLDSIGACSYSAVTNHILYEYRNKPEEFQKTFGYPMHDVEKGNLNDELLLVDLYVYTNRNKIFNISSTEDSKNERKTTFLEDAFYYEEKLTNDGKKKKTQKLKGQMYMARAEKGVRVDRINEFLDSKKTNHMQFNKIDLNLKETKELSNTQINNIVQKSLEDGKSINLGIYPNEKKPTMFIGLNGTEDFVCDGGHAVVITDTVEEGVVISSWGNKYVIPYDELKKNDFRISIISAE